MTTQSTSPRHTVIGLDGSPGAATALAWADAHPELIGRLRPVAAWRTPWWAVTPPSPGSVAPPPLDDVIDEVRRTAESMMANTVGDHDPVFVVQGGAGHNLVDLADDADLLVVGTRGRNAVADHLLGSVSSHVVAHAPCPVVVVPRDAEAAQAITRVVVGVDGSTQSLDALRWALANAPEGAEVEAIQAWSYAPYAGFEVTALDPALIEGQARASLNELVDKATGEIDRRVIRTVVSGDPRSVLAEAGETADLLVVGARGHRGVAHLLLGSVTTALAHRPPTPLVVVPEPDQK